MFISLVIRPGPEVCEVGKDEGDPFRLQDCVPISHLEMKMRSGSLASVSEASYDSSTGDVIVHGNFDASRL